MLFSYGNMKCHMYDGTTSNYKFLAKKYPNIEYVDILNRQFLFVKTIESLKPAPTTSTKKSNNRLNSKRMQ